MDVVLLHGWPGAPSDYDPVLPLLDEGTHVLAPDLFGPRHADATADAFAARVLEEAAAAGLERPVLAGYDIGSRIAQAAARTAPDRIAGLVITPAYPGIGDRGFTADRAAEVWYQHFHRLPVADAVLDGNRDAVAGYLAHFWTRWAAREGLATGAAFEAIVERYVAPGAMAASLAWYRQNRGYAADAPVSVPTTMLWPGADPLFPREWADALGDWFTDHELLVLEDVGHFVPVEAPEPFAAAVRAR